MDSERIFIRYKLLLAAKEHKYNVFPLLNDHYFGGSFTSVIDSVLYDKK